LRSRHGCSPSCEKKAYLVEVRTHLGEAFLRRSAKDYRSESNACSMVAGICTLYGCHYRPVGNAPHCCVRPPTPTSPTTPAATPAKRNELAVTRHIGTVVKRSGEREIQYLEEVGDPKDLQLGTALGSGSSHHGVAIGRPRQPVRCRSKSAKRANIRSIGGFGTGLLHC